MKELPHTHTQTQMLIKPPEALGITITRLLRLTLES